MTGQEQTRIDWWDDDDPSPESLLPPLDGEQETDLCESEVAVASYSYGGLMGMGRRGGAPARPRKKMALVLADDEWEAARRQLEITAVQDFGEQAPLDRPVGLGGLSPIEEEPIAQEEVLGAVAPEGAVPVPDSNIAQEAEAVAPEPEPEHEDMEGEVDMADTRLGLTAMSAEDLEHEEFEEDFDDSQYASFISAIPRVSEGGAGLGPQPAFAEPVESVDPLEPAEASFSAPPLPEPIVEPTEPSVPVAAEPVLDPEPDLVVGAEPEFAPEPEFSPEPVFMSEPEAEPTPEFAVDVVPTPTVEERNIPSPGRHALRARMNTEALAPIREERSLFERMLDWLRARLGF